MQSKKQRFAKKQTSALVLPQFVDQSVQHIHHLALPFWGQGFQSLGELCGVKQRCRIQIIDEGRIHAITESVQRRIGHLQELAMTQTPRQLDTTEDDVREEVAADYAPKMEL